MTESERRTRTEDKKAVGQWIRESRKARDWNQEALGKKVGVTQAMISGLESGKYSLPYEKLVELCAIFGVSTTDAAAAIEALATAEPSAPTTKKRVRKRTPKKRT
ncbi:MAG: helix-turn-helix transcriptional regulator [Methylotenera sp.]